MSLLGPLFIGLAGLLLMLGLWEAGRERHERVHKAVKHFWRRCTAHCRIVASMTAGEAIAMFHSALHWDMVAAYTIVSTWVKDYILKLDHRRHHAIKSVRTAGGSDTQAPSKGV